MKRKNPGLMFAGLFGTGALSMYFADSNRGKRRRAVLRDAIVHSVHSLQKSGRRFELDLEHRVQGTIVRTRHTLDKDPSDSVVERQIRTAMGRLVSHPGAVQINCTGGSVFLGGWILPDEVDEVINSVRSMKGVKEVSTFFNTTDHPEHISALQGGRRRSRASWFFRESWSPTERVLAGCVGGGLMLYGAIHRRFTGKAAAVNGAFLLTRSIFNAPLKCVAGVEPGPGIRIQKTISIHATPAELYEFWKNPLNYPKVFGHVDQVTREQENLFRWQVAGPAGIPVTWTGRITRQVPDKIVEWWSSPESIVVNHGTVRLEPEDDGRTRVHVEMSYTPPAGLLGHAVATLMGLDPKKAMDEDFIRLKSLFELGKTRTHGREVVKSQLEPPNAAAERVA